MLHSGGGVLGGLLHRLFGHFGLSLTCVELDPVVIEVARKVRYNYVLACMQACVQKASLKLWSHLHGL